MAPVPGARPRATTSTALAVLAALLLGTLVAVLGTRVPAGAEPPTARAAEPERPYAPGIDPALEADATIRGTALGPDGKLRDHVLVEAFSVLDPTGEPVASDLTYEVGDLASHGAYALHVPAGDYLVRLSSPEDARVVLEPTYYGGGAGTPVTVAPGQDLLLAPVTLQRDQGVPVTGRVVAADGEPMPDLFVSLVRVLADGISVRRSVVTDEDGRYRIDGVARNRAFTLRVWGAYDVHEQPLGLPHTWLGGTPSWYSAETITLSSRSTGREIDDLVVRPGVAVTGRVTTPTGSLEGADVALVHLHPDGLRGTVVAWDWVDGSADTYELAALPGRYTIAALAYGDYETGDYVFLGDTTQLSDARSFTIEDAPYDAGTLTVGAATSLVTVAVVDRDGEPADSFDLRPGLLDRHGEVIRWADQTAAGAFRARVPWGTEFTIGVYDWDYEEWVFLGDTSSFAGARFLTATSATPHVDAGTVSLAAPAPTAPAPVLGGRARVGQVLGVSVPTWSLPGVATVFQWLVDGAPVSGETSSSYLVRSADAGRRVAVRITGRVAGHAPGVVTTDGLLVGAGDAPTAIRPPTITGQAALGGTLTATPGAWDTAGVTTTLRWYADGEPIHTSVGRTWRVRPDGVGKQITVVETAVRDGHATGSSTSLPVRVDRRDPELRVSLRKGDLRAQVKAPGMQTERGRLVLLDGRRVVRSVDLNTTHRGVVVFDLARLRPGVHRLSVRYSGSAVSKADQSKAVTVRVP